MSDGFFRLTRSKRLNGGANLVHQGNGNGCAGTGNGDSGGHGRVLHGCLTVHALCETADEIAHVGVTRASRIDSFYRVRTLLDLHAVLPADRAFGPKRQQNAERRVALLHSPPADLRSPPYGRIQFR